MQVPKGSEISHKPWHGLSLKIYAHKQTYTNAHTNTRMQMHTYAHTRTCKRMHPSRTSSASHTHCDATAMSISCTAARYSLSPYGRSAAPSSSASPRSSGPGTHLVQHSKRCSALHHALVFAFHHVVVFAFRGPHPCNGSEAVGQCSPSWHTHQGHTAAPECLSTPGIPRLHLVQVHQGHTAAPECLSTPGIPRLHRGANVAVAAVAAPHPGSGGQGRVGQGAEAHTSRPVPATQPRNLTKACPALKI